jgi:hypothetical protein
MKMKHRNLVEFGSFMTIPVCPECLQPMRHTIFRCCDVVKHGWVCEPCQPKYVDADDVDWKRCCEAEDKKI